MSETTPRFKVGDIVQVVDTPNHENAFSWIGQMSRFCGKEVKITDVTKDHWKIDELDIYGYLIEGSNCLWDENCFVPVAQDIEESEFEIEFLLT